MNSAQYVYVDPVNGNLVCCICRTPFIDPVVTSTCSHTFCNECIRSALVVNPQCPVDRSPLTASQLQPAATIVRNLVDELIVECPHKGLGCDATCQRLHLDTHLSSSCQFVQVKCSEEGCSHQVLRKDLGKHAADCTHRLVECEACGRDVRLSDMAAHPEECPATEITCVNCSTTLPRSDLTSHLATCPHIPITCTHSLSGCAWTGPRHLLSEQHLPSCPYEAIKGFFAIHSAREKALELENLELRRKIEDLQRTSRSHQRDMDIAKLRLGPWFKPALEQDGGETASLGSNASHETMPGVNRYDPNRRRLSVPFNPAVFGVDDSPSEGNAQLRRSTISTAPVADMDPVHPSSAPSSRGPSFDDPYGPSPSFVPTAHPILSPNPSAGPSPLYVRAHSSSSNPVAPLNMSGSLEGTLASLRSSIVSLSGSLDSLERKQDIMLTTETLRMHEDVASLRAIVHGLRMQVHNIMMDRNTYFSNRNGAPSPTSQMAQHVTGQSLSRPPSSPNLRSPPPTTSAGGTSYTTVSHFPHSHHRTSGLSESGSHSDFSDGGPDTGVSSAARYFNQRPPTYFNLSPNVVTTVRRGPEGKL